MSEPKRIQLRRTKGWRKPEGAIVVSRPSEWGNPYPITEFGKVAVEMFKENLLTGECWLDYGGDSHRFRLVTITVDDVRAELRGHDLACWCPLDQPCHADVLLELANPQPLTMEERDG